MSLIVLFSFIDSLFSHNHKEHWLFSSFLPGWAGSVFYSIIFLSALLTLLTLFPRSIFILTLHCYIGVQAHREYLQPQWLQVHRISLPQQRINFYGNKYNLQPLNFVILLRNIGQDKKLQRRKTWQFSTQRFFWLPTTCVPKTIDIVSEHWKRNLTTTRR